MPFAKKVKVEYKACDTLPNERRILARVAVALQKRDIPILVIHEILRECGYDVAPRTLYRHVKGINDGSTYWHMKLRREEDSRSLMNLRQT